jgi:hypothetical protein
MTRLTSLLVLSVALGSGPVLAGPEMSKDYVLSIIKDAKPELDECGRSLKSEVVKTHFVIDTSGDVGDVKIDGKHAKDSVGSCLRAKLTSLKFGPSLKAMPVNMPLKLGEGGPTPPPADDAKVAEKSGGKKLDNKEMGDLLKVLQSNMGSCGAATTVQSSFTIQPNGQVRQVKIDGEHADDNVGKCVKTKLGRARFPAVGAKEEVTHEFKLD